MAPYVKYALIPFFLGLGAFGAYVTMATMMSNGFSDVLGAVATGARSTLLGAPEPFRRSYTGWAPLDNHLGVLVGFFSALLDGAVPPENSLFMTWGMAQFAAGWVIVVLEGLRAGNRGRVVGWTATFGLIFQNVAWTTALPIWLSVHLLTSPVAKLRNGDGAAARETLSARLWDLILLPTTITLTFLAPSILMALPQLIPQSPATHYGIIAFWQFFPLWTMLTLGVLRLGLTAAAGPLDLRDEKGELTTPGRGYFVAAGGVYDFANTVLVSTHLPILALAVAPAPLRSSLAAALPSYAGYIERGTFSNIFVPYSPFAPPTVVPTAYASGDLAPLATHFLQYDMLVASVPFLLWAVYLHQTTVKNPSLVDVVKKVGFWGLVGGPHAAVVALLRDRDAVVLEGEPPLAVEKKTN